MGMNMGIEDGKPAPLFKKEERGQKRVATGHNPRARGHWHRAWAWVSPRRSLSQKKKQEVVAHNPERTCTGMGMGRRMDRGG